MQNKKDFLPELIEFIDLANKIPGQYQFPNRTLITEMTYERLGNVDFVKFPDLIETYKIVLDNLPSDLKEFIFDKPPDNPDEDFYYVEGEWETSAELDWLVEKVDLLSTVTHILKTLAYYNSIKHFNSEEYPLEINEYLRGWQDDVPGYVAESKIKYFINDSGHIQIKNNEFIDFIQENNIEADRIRYCLVCSKVFWADRKDKWSCSLACGNAMRQRLWQSENRESYNEKRRENYAYKKSLEKRKE